MIEEMTTRVLQVFNSVVHDTNFWTAVADELSYQVNNHGHASDKVYCRYVFKDKSERWPMYLSLHLVRFAVRVLHLLYLLDRKGMLVYFF